jgi:hypothetical protein
MRSRWDRDGSIEVGGEHGRETAAAQGLAGGKVCEERRRLSPVKGGRESLA